MAYNELTLRKAGPDSATTPPGSPASRIRRRTLMCTLTRLVVLHFGWQLLASTAGRLFRNGQNRETLFTDFPVLSAAARLTQRGGKPHHR